MYALKVENLSKEYAIGERMVQANTLREQVASIFRPSAAIRRHAGKPRQERFWALKDVSFDVTPGEVVGIIGRNGAGKSTLLKILSRVTDPTEGRLVLAGRVSSLLEVGTGFHPELTGRENIFLNGAILGMGRAEIARKFEEIVAFSELEKFLDTPVKHYSSGMYVRLAFAVAAHLEPEVLIIDEVLAVGDIQFQRKCIGRMEEVGREGRTILYVSHNLIAIRAMCSRVLLLEGGRLAVDGDPATTIARYAGESQGVVLHREWPDAQSAPQTEAARLVEVTVRPAGGDAVAPISTDTGWNVETTYVVKQDGAFVGLTVILFDGDDNEVFSSINNREPEWYSRPMPAGLYRSVCHVPPCLMNCGWFRLAVYLFGRNFGEGRMVRDILRFEIADGLALRGDYHGVWGGVVRPDLTWTTSRLMGDPR